MLTRYVKISAAFVALRTFEVKLVSQPSDSAFSRNGRRESSR